MKYAVYFKGGKVVQDCTAEDVLLLYRQTTELLINGELGDDEDGPIVRVSTRLDDNRVFVATNMFVAANKVSSKFFDTKWIEDGEDLADFIEDLGQAATAGIASRIDEAVSNWDEFPFKD